MNLQTLSASRDKNNRWKDVLATYFNFETKLKLLKINSIKYKKTNWWKIELKFNTY